MDTIKKALKKENIEMISLACIRSMTQEIRESIEELEEQIKSYGVMASSHIFLNYDMISYLILCFLFFQVIW